MIHVRGTLDNCDDYEFMTPAQRSRLHAAFLVMLMKQRGHTPEEIAATVAERHPASARQLEQQTEPK